MEESHLWDLIRAGREEAFKELFHTNFRMMVHCAYRYVQDESIAKDMAQDVFVKIWDRRGKLQLHGSVKSYLLQATRNNCLNFLKKRKLLDIDAHMEPFANQHSIQEELQADDLQKIISHAIGKMPPACRAVFLMRRSEELPVKAIAEAMKISPKTVENQLTKARKILAKYLKPILTMIWLYVQKIC